MSQENALTFVRKVYQDPGLQAKVRPLAKNDTDGLLKIAADAGFDFTIDDFLAAQVSANEPSAELGDDDLEQIAGGKGSTGIRTILFKIAPLTMFDSTIQIPPK